MARRNRKQQAMRVFLNGKRADHAYGLSERVGGYIGRTNQARKLAAVALARKAIPAAKRQIQRVFNIDGATIGRRMSVRDTGDTLRIYAHNRRVPLIEFGGRWGGRHTRGATASILRGRSETFAQSFIRRVRGLESIRVRQSRGLPRRVGRGPLTMLFGPSVRDMITGHKTDPESRTPTGSWGDQVHDRLRLELVETYIAELQRQLARLR